MAQIYRRICRPSAVNGMAACAVRLTRSRLPAALARATGPGERCQRRAAAAVRHDFFMLFWYRSRFGRGSTMHQPRSPALRKGAMKGFLPVSAACDIHTWCLRLVCRRSAKEGRRKSGFFFTRAKSLNSTPRMVGNRRFASRVQTELSRKKMSCKTGSEAQFWPLNSLPGKYQTAKS